VFVMYALYNIVFLPTFYKTASRAGLSFVLGGSVVMIYIVAVEAAIQMIPVLNAWLDTSDPAMMVRQLPVLIAGIGIYALFMFLAYRMSAKRFEKVDL
jgi:ABC-2 type transport system permease protein